MGNRRDYEQRKDAKVDKLQSIRMMPRAWLKRFDTWKEFKEELKT